MPTGINVDNSNIYTVYNLSAGSLNADLVPSTDVSQYEWLNMSIGNDAYSGLIVPQWSNDNTNWFNLKMYPMTTLDAGDVVAAGTEANNVVLGTFVSFNFFRARMTSYTSGTATGTLQLFHGGLPGFQLTTTYVRLMSAANQIGFTNNDGRQNLAIAAGHAGNTVVSSLPGMLGSILVTTSGTHEMVIYDDAASPTGNIIAIVPASTARGTIIRCYAPASVGMVVAGDSNNPGVTIFF